MNTKPRKKRKKLDDALRASIWTARRAGAPVRTIASTLGVSIGLVSGVLRGPEPETSPAPPTCMAAPAPPAIESSSLPSRDDLRALLAEQIAQLRADVSTASDPQLRAGLYRALLGAQNVLSRITPGADEGKGVWVDREEIDTAATRVRKRWHDLADRLVEVSTSPLADSIRRLLDGREFEDEGESK